MPLNRSESPGPAPDGDMTEAARVAVGDGDDPDLMEVSEMRDSGFVGYFTDGWNIMDWINFVLLAALYTLLDAKVSSTTSETGGWAGMMGPPRQALRVRVRVRIRDQGSGSGWGLGLAPCESFDVTHLRWIHLNE